MRRTVYRRRKSVFAACLLSLIWPGLGQIYLGYIARGILFLLVQGVFLGLSGLPERLVLIILHRQAAIPVDNRLAIVAAVFLVYGLADAVRAARRINRPRYIERRGL
ncbi:MAG TPA: hypothetical protein GX506_07750 [Firmicutes bacterium]|nr:hypothetical protein [Bacillota bacterium]